MFNSISPSRRHLGPSRNRLINVKGKLSPPVARPTIGRAKCETPIDMNRFLLFEYESTKSKVVIYFPEKPPLAKTPEMPNTVETWDGRERYSLTLHCSGSLSGAVSVGVPYDRSVRYKMISSQTSSSE
jgi:hypothetical protein